MLGIREKDEKMVMELVQYYNKRTGSKLSGNMIVNSINALLNKLPLSDLAVEIEDTWVTGDYYVDSNNNLKTSNDELNKAITNADNQVAKVLLFSIDFYIYGFSKMLQLMIEADMNEERLEVFLNYCNYYKQDVLIVFTDCDMENGFNVDTNKLNHFILELLKSKACEVKEDLEDVEWAIESIEKH